MKTPEETAKDKAAETKAAQTKAAADAKETKAAEAKAEETKAAEARAAEVPPPNPRERFVSKAASANGGGGPPALILPDGQRVCLTMLLSYGIGGDSAIHFNFGTGKVVEWRCPHSWLVNGVMKPASASDREEAAKGLLAAIDESFDVRDFSDPPTPPAAD